MGMVLLAGGAARAESPQDSAAVPQGLPPPLPPGELAPYEKPPGFQLKPTGDGGYSYSGDSFRARIAADGTVTFLRPVPFGWDGPEPHVIGRDPLVSPDLANDQAARNLNLVGIPEYNPLARFDATDEYMRLVGHQDPARAEKARFLAATSELRANMAQTAQSERSRQALMDLPTRLDTLWRDPRFTPLQRRQLLRAWWDELGDGADADQARAIIRGFARVHLTPEEAAEYDRPGPAPTASP
jgi:hypothetical protein